MKANELRIGNYVLLEDKGVYQIDSGHDIEEVDSFDESDSYCVGIPLTEDWLIKFGFTKIDRDDEDFTYFKKGNIEFTDVSPNGIELVWYELSPCISIHQLQNLYFALTGEELSIKD